MSKEPSGSGLWSPPSQTAADRRLRQRLTRESCDSLVALSAVGPVPSLNVAAATAACLTVLSAQ